MRVQVVGEDAVGGAAAALEARLRNELAGLRPLHPVSFLDVSPGLELGAALMRLPRGAGRKLRVMTYAWNGPKPRDRRGGPPEPMVEKGDLPGLHFSQASFDFVVGVGVLEALAAPLYGRVLGELTATAMRAVWLAEPLGGPVTGAVLGDALLGAGLHDARIEREPAALLVRIQARYAAAR